ncbi:hypothetical protein GY15_09635 [Delftia sp. 670]|nr:hypothetical protein GY15_09635 [Delftia sp. 670]
MLAQHLAAAFVHHAGGGADLGVGVAGHVFLHEVHEARLALQQAQQLQGGGASGCGRLRDGLFDDLLDRHLDTLFNHFLDHLLDRHLDADLDDPVHGHLHAHLLGCGRRHVGGQRLPVAQAGHIGGQGAVAEDGEETADRDGDAAQERGGSLGIHGLLLARGPCRADRRAAGQPGAMVLHRAPQGP